MGTEICWLSKIPISMSIQQPWRFSSSLFFFFFLFLKKIFTFYLSNTKRLPTFEFASKEEQRMPLKTSRPHT